MSQQQQILEKLGFDTRIIAHFIGLGATSLLLVASLPTMVVWSIWAISKIAQPLIFNPWYKACKNFTEGYHNAKKENEIKLE